MLPPENAPSDLVPGAHARAVATHAGEPGVHEVRRAADGEGRAGELELVPPKVGPRREIPKLVIVDL